ncbi:hypothetical protein BGZ52_009576 [Haplosporangium bisporale]|nr:hypothetical protein BGZ52_009576 [Haplosporangium bisporale]
MHDQIQEMQTYVHEIGSPARDEPMHPLQPQHQERPPSQQWYRQGMSVSVSVPKRESHDDGDERRYSIDPPRWNDAKYPSYPPSGSGSGSGYLKPSPSYSPSPTTHTRPQNHHVWDGAEPNGSTAHSPSTTPSSIYTPLPYYPSYARSLPSSSQAHPYTPQRPPTIAHPEDYRQQESNLQPNSNLDSHDEDEDEDEDYDDESWQSAKNLGFKFGTDMPTTIDLKAAIDSCETLCKFALHYARQNQVHRPQGHPGPDSLLLEEHERATLQAIRSMSSAMLIGLRNVNNKESDKEGKEGKDKESREGGEDLPESEPVFSPESSVKFGKGAPSDKMVHELAKAATSIFQLAIRIKAWVNMTPEERELDEEINIIRGRRCLVMDGSSSALDQVGHPQTDWAMLQAKSTFHTPMEKRVQHHQESMSKGMDPMEIDRNFGGGEGHSGHISFPGGSGSKAKSKTVAKAGSSSKDEAPPQKYRKRAKRTHPPGRCMSCDSSDTPEWRRGPDGARTLCNACGLHYAKLLKRQNREHKAKQDQQLQFISFPFRKRAKSESPETHRDGFNESDAVKAENDSLEQDPQDTSEPGQQQQQPSPVGQDSETPLAPMGTESVPTITPVPGS